MFSLTRLACLGALILGVIAKPEKHILKHHGQLQLEENLGKRHRGSSDHNHGHLRKVQSEHKVLLNHSTHERHSVNEHEEQSLAAEEDGYYTGSYERHDLLENDDLENDAREVCTVSAADAKKIQEAVLGGGAATTPKRALFLIGGSGAGKSTIRDSLYLPSISMTASQFILLDSDDVKGRMPQYQALLARGVASAASDCHQASSDLNNDNLNKALNGNKNVILDGTGKNFASTSGHMKMAKDKGFQVHVVIVKLKVEVAVSRAKKRGEETGRVIPESTIREIHEIVNSNIPKYEALGADTVDCLTVYDNSGATATKVNSIRQCSK